jgi:hypothetical protein
MTRSLLAAVVLLAACATQRSERGPSSGLPFIKDDFSAALARAQQAQLPLFVDAWAPW